MNTVSIGAVRAEVRYDRGHPVDAFLVPLAQRETLQQAIDTHHVIRLETLDIEAGPNYRDGNRLTSITLRSGIAATATSQSLSMRFGRGCAALLGRR